MLSSRNRGVRGFICMTNLMIPRLANKKPGEYCCSPGFWIIKALGSFVFEGGMRSGKPGNRNTEWATADVVIPDHVAEFNG